MNQQDIIFAEPVKNIFCAEYRRRKYSIVDEKAVYAKIYKPAILVTTSGGCMLFSLPESRNA